MTNDASKNHQPVGTGAMPPDVPEIEIVHTRRFACDGGEGALGHPRVWLTIESKGYVECGYCDKRFILADDADTY